MTTVDLIIAFTVVLCLLISFLFSGSETALTSSSRASMLRLEKQGNADAVIVNRLLAEREQMIGALLIGTNVANIAGSTLATGLFLEWFGDPSYALIGLVLVDQRRAPSGASTPGSKRHSSRPGDYRCDVGHGSGTRQADQLPGPSPST